MERFSASSSKLVTDKHEGSSSPPFYTPSVTHSLPTDPACTRISEKSGSSLSVLSLSSPSSATYCIISCVLPRLGGGDNAIISGALGRRWGCGGRSGLRGGIVGSGVCVFSDKKLGWFCIVVMGVPGRGGDGGREWVVLLVLLLLLLLMGLLLLLLLPGGGLIITGCVIWWGVSSLSVSASCSAMTGDGGDGALRIRRRCLIDILRAEAALSGRGGIDVGIDNSALLR